MKPNELWVNLRDCVRYELPKTNNAPAPIRLRDIDVVTVLSSLFLKKYFIPSFRSERALFWVVVTTLWELVFKENNKIVDTKNVNESTKNTTEPLQPLPYETIYSINFSSEKNPNSKDAKGSDA